MPPTTSSEAMVNHKKSIVKLHAEGVPINEIATKVHQPESTVKRIIEETTRSKSKKLFDWTTAGAIF